VENTQRDIIQKSGKRVVLTGDEVAVSEEFEAGAGTYEHEGKIYAMAPGILNLDYSSKMARVEMFNPPVRLEVGDIVYATVDDIRNSMSTATVFVLHGTKRKVSGETESSIHISNVSSEYTDDFRRVFRLGDIIRAQVIQSEPSLQLTMAGPNLGVVKALCSNCRGPLVRKDSGLYCERCETTESRKIAADYGDLKLDSPAKDMKVEISRERRERRDDRRTSSSRDRGGRERGRSREYQRRRGGGRGRPPKRERR